MRNPARKHASTFSEYKTRFLMPRNGHNKDEVRTKLGASPVVAYLVSLGAMQSSQLGMTARHNFVLPDRAADSVNSSADSRPPPAGIPRAMRVSATGLFFNRSTM